MEFTHEIYFDPTPKLKSSPVQIFFLPFNNEKLNCYNCGDKYSDTLSYKQKYCKQCLLRYIKSRVDNNEYFDVNIITNNTPCNKHESTRDINFTTRNIQEWCEVCSEISYFKNYYVQINTKIQHIFMEKDCKLCGKSIDEISYGFKMCSNCYLIHSGWIKSIFDTTVPILCLPWWDASNKSKACNHNLKFLTDCQKWCSSCFIVYVGCRHCLTTNIIFGITNQTKCRKCKRVSDICIDFIDMCGGNSIIAEYLISMKTNNQSYNKIACYMNKGLDPLNVYTFIECELKDICSKKTIEWIPYSKIDNLEIIAEGGLGTIYKATCSNNFVAVKRFSNSKDISRHFLNEINSLHRCYNTAFIVKYYGITQDPDSQIKDYMLIMEYASDGNLHNYLRENFTNIKWTTKLAILCQISDGLKTIHNENFVHRNFHSGNILSLKGHKKWVIGDLGLSRPANNSSYNEIYGVIPYVAPEIFGGDLFSKNSDVYSFGMIMWELTTGCKPFVNTEHDINLISQIIVGKRPEITFDTPECFANLMKSCWDSDPFKRPSIRKIRETVDDWYKKRNKTERLFIEAEERRSILTRSGQLCPQFIEKHPGAIYTSRSLNSFISQLLNRPQHDLNLVNLDKWDSSDWDV
ncbi:kinase-like protein [Rhizophagus irregularis]|uniref:Kinase-like protein n=2 Tax=Rhizophagus irregularis TaxID=588596 RepID=A0A2N0PHS9_9GLOM|nr:Cdc15p [Rhizophagus irregularis DAOM 197198w]PKC06384.1 kinase-like protein [Rhizophagus irregularis]